MAYVGNIAFTVTAKQLEKALEGCAVAKVNNTYPDVCTARPSVGVLAVRNYLMWAAQKPA